VVEPAPDRERQGRRHVDERVEPVVGAAGLEDEDTRRRVRAQAVRQDAPGAATADDHVVPGAIDHPRAMLAARQLLLNLVAAGSTGARRDGPGPGVPSGPERPGPDDRQKGPRVTYRFLALAATLMS